MLLLPRRAKSLLVKDVCNIVIGLTFVNTSLFVIKKQIGIGVFDYELFKQTKDEIKKINTVINNL